MASRTFFPRGSGPLISFLIPTRGRSEGLQNAIKTAYDLAQDKTQIEFLVRIDSDDEVTIKLIPLLESQYKDQIRFIIGSRGNGYADLHLMCNELAFYSKGDWLFLFNDDSEITTPNYDQIVSNVTSFSKFPGISNVCLLQFQQVGDPRFYSFVALRKETYESLGYFSLFPHCDLWLFNLMNCVEAVLPVQVYVKHNQDQATDKTGKEGVSSSVNIWRKMKSPCVLQDKLMYAKKLIDSIFSYRFKMNWEKEPTTSGWYWWSKAEGFELPMLVFRDSGKFNLNIGNEIKTIEGGEIAIGPDGGSDSKSKLYNIKELGGKWAAI